MGSCEELTENILRIKHGKDSLGRDIIVRRAWEWDYEAVMDINREVYDGLDYLPELYNTYLHDKQHALYVVELDEKVVSFAIFGLSGNDNRSVYSLALRTHPRYQGRGLSAYKNQTLRSFIVEDFSEVQYELHTRYSSGLLNESGSDLLYKWKCLGYRITSQDFESILSICSSITNTTTLHSSYTSCLKLLPAIKQFFSNRQIHCFPFGTEWKPAEVCWNNLKHLCAISHSYVTLNTKCDSHRNPESDGQFRTNFDSKLEENARVRDAKDAERYIEIKSDTEIQAMSFRCIFLCGDVPNADIYFYGDLNYANEHLSAQITDVIKLCDDEALLAFHFEDSADFEVMEEITERFGMGNGKLENFFDHLNVHIFRKPF